MSPTLSADLNSLSEETIPVILPTPARIFEKRSARLRFLAPGHALGAYLEAMARLAEAQVAASHAPASDNGGNVTVSTPPLPFDLGDSGHREAWQKALHIIVSEMQLVPLPEPSQDALSRLSEVQSADLESSACAILNGNVKGIDRSASPFLSAALQTYWTGLASRVQTEATGPSAGSCPICASPPVAGIVLSGRKLRYLCCSLCATHWYVPRLTCINCGSTAGISYFTVDGDTDGTKAEACSQCKTYLKLFYQDSNPETEAFADDLATLTLDLLMSNQGYSRSGVNLFLLPE
jgi:FdhE protein